MASRTAPADRYSKVSRRLWTDEWFVSLGAIPCNPQTLWFALLTALPSPVPGLAPVGVGWLCDILGWTAAEIEFGNCRSRSMGTGSHGRIVLICLCVILVLKRFFVDNLFSLRLFHPIRLMWSSLNPFSMISNYTPSLRIGFKNTSSGFTIWFHW